MCLDMHKYTELLDKIDDNMDLYYNKYMNCTRFILYLSNNEKIEISYDSSSISHLFGINTNFLRSTGLFPTSSLDILYDILDNPNRLASQIKNGHIKNENVFSDYIDDKLDNFENICGIDISKIEFVSKYDKEKSFNLGEEPLDGEYYIGFRNKSDTLSIIGFTNNNGLYFPITNLKFDYHSEEKDKFLRKLLKNQTLMYVQTLRKNTIKNDKVDRVKIYYNAEDKVKKMELIDKYADEYGAVCDTHKNYLYHVKKNSNLQDEKIRIWEIVNKISETIISRKMIRFSELGQKFGKIDENLTNLIGAYNDFLVNNNVNDNDNHYSYSDIITELEETKREIIKKEELINKINEMNKSLASKNETLENENEKLNDNMEKIRSIVSNK